LCGKVAGHLSKYKKENHGGTIEIPLESLYQFMRTTKDLRAKYDRLSQAFDQLEGEGKDRNLSALLNKVRVNAPIMQELEELWQDGQLKSIEVLIDQAEEQFIKSTRRKITHGEVKNPEKHEIDNYKLWYRHSRISCIFTCLRQIRDSDRDIRRGWRRLYNELEGLRPPNGMDYTVSEMEKSWSVWMNMNVELQYDLDQRGHIPGKDEATSAFWTID
jgi:hypothetical protein